MTAAKPQEWTCEDYLALPEGEPFRYGVIDGELYLTFAPNIRHQEISGKFYLAIAGFLLNAPQYIEPDLVFPSKERSAIVTE